jgi:hypothetical protein
VYCCVSSSKTASVGENQRVSATKTAQRTVLY